MNRFSPTRKVSKIGRKSTVRTGRDPFDTKKFLNLNLEILVEWLMPLVTLEIPLWWNGDPLLSDLQLLKEGNVKPLKRRFNVSLCLLSGVSIKFEVGSQFEKSRRQY